MNEADQLERDLEQDREHLRETLEALEDKMSPGRLIDEVMTHFNTGPKAFASDLADQIRDNPMPALLTGVGLTWLMMADRRPTGSPTAASKPGFDGSIFPTDPADYDALHAHDRLQQAEWACVRSGDESAEIYAKRLDQSRAAALGVTYDADTQEDIAVLSTRIREAAEVVKHKGASVREKLKQASVAAKDQTRSAMEVGAEGVQSAAASVRNGAEAAMSSARHLHETNPVATAAIGVAIGALLGAALPLSRQEESALGAMADKALAAGADLGRSASDAVSEGLQPGAEETTGSGPFD